MRYYKIEVGGKTYTSLVNGKSDPGALNVELDLPVGAYGTPLGGAFVRIWGIPLEAIAQARDLNEKPVSVYGGMQTGLPLANPAQSGLLLKGSAFPAFGNWIGTDMTLDIVVVPDLGGTSESSAKNIVHDWQKGTPLENSIRKTLQTAFPSFKQDIRISQSLVLNYNDTGFYQNIAQFSAYIKQISQSIMGAKTYPGVNISTNGDTIVVTDGTQQASSVKQIDFKDLIGQPTWLSLNVISVKTVMRADLKIGDTVKLPPSLATTQASSASQFRANSAFQGQFMIQEMRHVGNFRQPDAASWNTTFNVVSLGTAGDTRG